MGHPIKLNRRWRAEQLALSIGVALLCLGALPWGLRGVTPAHADSGDLYVDGAAGRDIPTCGITTMPCQTISYTLNSRATSGAIIRVAQGVYGENLTIHISVILEGGYEALNWTRSITQYETVIDGSGSTIVQPVVAFDGGSGGAVLDGFIITGGDSDAGGGVHIANGGSTVVANAVIAGNHAQDGGGLRVTGNSFALVTATMIISNTATWGGGILVDLGASASIVDSVIQNNTAISSGGGVDAWWPNTTVVISQTVVADNSSEGDGGGIHATENAAITLINASVTRNTAGGTGAGIAVRGGAPAVIRDSQIDTNTALGAGGGGIIVSDASLSLSNSRVAHNDAPNGQSGGIDVSSGAAVNVVDSVIAGNSTRDHGGAATIDPSATLDLTNSLVIENSTTSGNANVFAVSGDVTIMNSTISDNNPLGAQAVILWSGHLTITNSVLWNNALSLQGDPPCPTCFTVTYSDLQGGWAGAGNIDADPLFVGGGDYRLQMDSPCIDAGTNTGAPDHDLDQRQRPQDGDGDGTATTDMGAYEFRLYRIYFPRTLRNFRP